MTRDSQRKEKRAAAKWLLSLVGEDWGIRVLPAGADKPRPVHANRNKRIEAVIGSRAARKPDGRASSEFAALVEAPCWESGDEPRSSGTWLDRLSQKHIIRHFDGVPREFRIKGEIVVKPEPSSSPARDSGRARPA